MGLAGPGWPRISRGTGPKQTTFTGLPWLYLHVDISLGPDQNSGRSSPISTNFPIRILAASLRELVRCHRLCTSLRRAATVTSLRGVDVSWDSALGLVAHLSDPLQRGGWLPERLQGSLSPALSALHGKCDMTCPGS